MLGGKIRSKLGKEYKFEYYDRTDGTTGYLYYACKDANEANEIYNDLDEAGNLNIEDVIT